MTQVNGTTTYMVFGPNGQTMVPIAQSGLAVGQVVSYGDMANPRQDAVVIEEHGSGFGQRCIFIESLRSSHVSQTAIDGPGGWHLEDDEPWTAEAIADLIQRAEAKERERQAAANQKETEREQLLAQGKDLFESHCPAWAQAAIVAQYMKDESDPMTDYFHMATKQTIVLAWSKHTRDLFPEMRKAALLFPETKHLGPGCDEYTAAVVFTEDVPRSNGERFFKGDYSPYHTELDGGKYEHPTFHTLAEANAHIAEKGEPEPILIGHAEEPVSFEWKIRHESIEHREKWSMGSGYYLQGKYQSGWRVRKILLPTKDAQAAVRAAYSHVLYMAFAKGDFVHEKDQEPKERPTVQLSAAHGIKVQKNEEKNGIEVVFADKPDEIIRQQLKQHGFRWSRRQGLWYAKQTPQRLAFVEQLSA